MLRLSLDISALDPNFKEHAMRGIGRYVRNLYSALQKLELDDIEFSTFSHAELMTSQFLKKVLSSVPKGKQTLEQQIMYPYKLYTLKNADVLHFPAQMDPPAICPKPYIVSVMDLIPLVLEDMYKADSPNLRFKFARFLERKAITNASLIITISETTANDVERILGVPREKIFVTPLGVDEKFFGAKLIDNEEELRARYNIPEKRPLLLYVGGIDQRKNCKGMLEVLRRLKRVSSPAPVLLMAGKIEKDKHYPDLLSSIKKYGLEDDVVLAGFVPDEDLLQLYKICTAFLFLSYYEGFGLPPLEALAAGCPVVSSNVSAMPEVLGDAAELVSPDDFGGASEAILRIMNDPEYASRLREKGFEQAKKFTWESTAEKTVLAYRKYLEISRK